MRSPFTSKSTERLLVKKNTENIYLRKLNPLNNIIGRPKLDLSPSSFAFKTPRTPVNQHKGKSFNSNSSRQTSYENRSLYEKYSSIPKFMIKDIMNKQWRNNLQIQQRKLLKIGGAQVLRETPSYYKNIATQQNEDYYDQKKSKNKNSSILKPRVSGNTNILLNSITSIRESKLKESHSRNSAQTTPTLGLKRQLSCQSSCLKKSALKTSLPGFGLRKKQSKIRFSETIDQNALNSARLLKSSRQSDIKQMAVPQKELRFSSSGSFGSNSFKNFFPGVIGLNGSTFKRIF